MKILITVWETFIYSTDDGSQAENTVHVRYPDVNRVKGAPHDIQEYYRVPCSERFSKKLYDQNNGRRCYYDQPDFDAINAIIDKYRQIGDVEVHYNCDTPDIYAKL